MKLSRRAERDDELDIEKEDVVLVFDKREDGWCRALSRDMEGFIPVNYLQGCMFV